MEKFMIKKNILAASIAAVTMAGGMIAQVQAIEIAENDIGQVLLAPTYIADSTNGVTTRIAIANTRTDYAVKAKVVFREAVHSSEVLDFVIYLSPGDVWRGEVIGDTTAASITSSDDSFTDGSTFASASNTMTQPFFDKENSQSNGFGHFEVYGAYAARVGTYAPGTSSLASTVIVQQGMSKGTLKSLFDLTRAEQSNLLMSNGAAISSVTPNWVQLTGTVIIQGGNGERAGYNIPALAPSNYDIVTNRGEGVNLADGTNAPAGACAATAPYSCVSNYVITNDQFDVTVAAPTRMGESFGDTLGTWIGDRGDHVIDIEWALARSMVTFLYEHDGAAQTNPIVAFVTKYLHRSGFGGSDVCGAFTGVMQGVSTATTGDDGIVGPKEYFIPFDDTTVGAINRMMVSYDNSEGSATVQSGGFSGGTAPAAQTLPIEVNYLPGLPFYSTSGWAYIGLTQQTGLTAVAGATVSCSMYAGMPALSATLKSGADGMNFMWDNTPHH
jgi:hypothetical protein